MALDFAQFTSRYPLLWHLTPERNLERIERTRVMESAASLMAAANDFTWMRRRRPVAQALVVDGGVVWLRDQEPLAAGAIDFQGGWTLERLLEEINKRVYFWPGDSRGPIGRARENFEAFRGQPEIVALRIPTTTVTTACRPFQLQLTSVNVGAPRVSGARKSPRGPRTFMAPGAFDGTPSDVREVTVLERLDLGAIWSSVEIEWA